MESWFFGQSGLTAGQRLADRMAALGGSWTFLIVFAIVMVLWIAVNSVVLIIRPFDPNPFIFLNLVSSCLAAIQAPVIMMSQVRQEARDRLHAMHAARGRALVRDIVGEASDKGERDENQSRIMD